MPKKIENLENKIFGRLTVKSYAGLSNAKRKSMWNCICVCGNTCVISHRNLVRGSTKSCGCLRQELASKDLIGQTFGNLVVIKKFGYKRRYKDREILWECKCKCGNIHIVSTALLCNGHVKSCGCKNSKTIYEITGNVYGQLTVISFDKRINNRTYWNCRCICGNEKSLDAHHLKSGSQQSCGCRMGGWKHGLSLDKKAYRKYLMSDPVRRLRHYTGIAIRKSLKLNGGKKNSKTWKSLPYTPQELKEHLEKLWEPWMNWDNYGGRPNENKKTWWIDHIIPQSMFQYTSFNDPLFLECWALKNLRPLEKIQNIKKGNKLLNQSTSI